MLGYETGMYVEIYLPKKAIYQPFLFDVLTKGFDVDYVKKHFQDNKVAIGRFVDFPAWERYSETFINDFRPLLFGYSMYEVDGIFKGPSSTTPVIEERTQIIRLMFKADPASMDENWDSTQSQFVRSKISEYLRSTDREGLVAESPEGEQYIFEEVRNWRDRLGFFVFGYIVYEFCRNLIELSQQGQVEKLEDEIWVTNFANLELDRIVRVPS